MPMKINTFEKIHERLKIELDELRREIGQKENNLKIEIMPDQDDDTSRGYVTLAELRKYIMMAADEMSTSMKTYLDENIHSMQDQIKQLQTDLKKEKSRNDGGGGSGSGGGGTSGGPEMVKKRSFDQLVKEVDQCFAELGRQVQREAKHRQTMEAAIHQLELNIPEQSINSRHGGFDPEVDKRLSKCE